MLNGIFLFKCVSGKYMILQLNIQLQLWRWRRSELFVCGQKQTGSPAVGLFTADPPEGATDLDAYVKVGWSNIFSGSSFHSLWLLQIWRSLLELSGWRCDFMPPQFSTKAPHLTL